MAWKGAHFRTNHHSIVFQSRLLKCFSIAQRELMTSGNSASTVTIIRQRKESEFHGSHLVLTLEQTNKQARMFVQKGLHPQYTDMFSRSTCSLHSWIWPQIVFLMPWRLNKVRVHSLNTAQITMGRNSFKRKFHGKILHNFWLPTFSLVLSAKKIVD